MKLSRGLSLMCVVAIAAAILLPFTAASALPSYPLSAYRFADGTKVCDPAGDASPGYSDIDCNSSEGASVYVGSDGVTMAGAFVLNQDPRTTSQQAPFSSNAYVIQIATGGTHVATLGIDAKGTADSDAIYGKCEGNASLNYTKKLSTAIADGDAAVTAEPTGLWRVTFVVPLSAIASCGVAPATPVKLFFGTSQAGNLDVINKDFMTGAAVSFANTATIAFDGTLTVTSVTSVVSGPNPPVAGQTTVYDLTITASNTGASPVTGVTVLDSVSAGVSIVSVTTASGAATVTGSDVTWTGFDLPGGMSATLVVRVSITPAPSQVGSTVTLDTGPTASGTGGEGPVSADAPAQTSQVVGGASVTIAKTASPSSVNAGEPVTYTITLTNGGTAAATVDSVTDSLPSGFTFVAGSTGGTLGAGAPATSSSSVAWAGPFILAAGATRNLTFDALAGPAGGTFTNTASAALQGLPGISTGAVAPVAVNAAPVAQDDSASTPMSLPVNILPLANDADPEGSLDPSTLSIVTGPTNGSGTIDAPSATITYTPGLAYVGLDVIEYRVCDSGGACDTATITIAVGPVNLPPVAADDTIAATEDVPASFLPLANDSDPDGPLDPSSLAIVSGPGSGDASLAGTAITYVPDENFNGWDSIIYRICDDEAACDTATVTLIVAPVNDPPVAFADAAATDEDVAVLVDVLANDTDVDGPLDTAVTVVSTPAAGAAIPNAVTGSILYVPSPDASGADAFTYRVCDLEGACDTAAVAITVAAVNDPPAAADDVAVTDEDTPVVIDVLANDVDAENGLVASALAVVTPAATGGAAPAAGMITYTPAPDAHGSDTFTYGICDADGECVTANVLVTVRPVNDAPVANADAGTTAQDEPLVIAVLGNDTDPDDDDLVLGDMSGKAGVVANPDGTLTYVPPVGFAGVDRFTYAACDPSGECSDATVDVIVAAASAPIAGTTVDQEPLPVTGSSTAMLVVVGLGSIVLGAGVLRRRAKLAH